MNIKIFSGLIFSLLVSCAPKGEFSSHDQSSGCISNCESSVDSKAQAKSKTIVRKAASVGVISKVDLVHFSWACPSGFSVQRKLELRVFDSSDSANSAKPIGSYALNGESADLSCEKGRIEVDLNIPKVSAHGAEVSKVQVQALLFGVDSMGKARQNYLGLGSNSVVVTRQ